MIRRLHKLWPLAVLMLVLAGCSSNPASHPINRESGIWDRYFVGPLSDVLDWFAKVFWGQYGLSILAVTLIVRFLILPLTLKQYKSSKAMQALQPEMKKLKEKYKDDPKKQQEETMKLFQTHGVNPLAGCFPLIVQMPVLIALYNSIMRNPNISGHDFLWLKLGEPDHFYILPALAAFTTFLQQKVMMATNTNNQMPQMNFLLFVLPVLIFVMSMNFASALPLYWVYTNLFTVVQTYLIYRPSKK
ncbi:membrane protein insertase YidC [Paenibacillus aurantius]|uniref:Membrane protein insertase YidC n=1 Tax=Paenibacillus aurantius TaxID=2918900 RepID=A0AA96RFQ8_9BACL|nr:membrane protein insertase YidC [Paenibacillus aurantius]WJH36224.1 membrane protein insertase YidC [Paenibacillus sp. CC-CFT747]WNQ11503.1 membrane protein insertase YidC [Paenibacillus aurantius]